MMGRSRFSILHSAFCLLNSTSEFGIQSSETERRTQNAECRMKKRRWSGAAALFSLTLAIAPSLHAQLASDEVPRQRTVARSEEIKQQLEDSRWHLGGMRLRPVFGLRDLGYDNNVYVTAEGQAVADWRGTVSAGADILLPMGNKLYLTGTVEPSYTYYQKTVNRRLLGGQYAGSLLGLFNHLSVEAGGSTEKTVAPVSSEIDQAAPGTLNDGFARAELDIFRRLSLFGSAETQQQRYKKVEGEIVPGFTLDPLERDETVVRGGLRYKIRSYFDISVAAEQGKSDFVTANYSDNKTRAVLVGIHYDRPRFFLNLSGGNRTGEPNGPLSTFPRFSKPTGSYYAEYELGAPLIIDAYGHNRVTYSIDARNPYYLETRNGLGLTIPVGDRMAFRAFGEAGSNAYEIADRNAVKRKDDVTIFGGGIAYRLYRKVMLSVQASQTRYDSNVEFENRSIFRIATMLSLRGDSFR